MRPTVKLPAQVAVSSIEAAPEIRRRNFFPFPLLWFSLVALEISVISGPRMADADIWMHLRNAQQLVTTHHFLHSDLYSFTAAGSPLVNHEWLSELPFYFAFRAWGLHGLLAVFLVTLWMIFGAMYYLALRRGANCTDAALVTMGAVAVGSFCFGPRMFQFGWLCLAGLLLVLERFLRNGKGLWLLPPLFALWINLHGSWPFGFVVLGIYVVAGLMDLHLPHVVSSRWSPLELRKLLVASAVSVPALFANPYGYKLVLYPFDLLFRQKANMGNVLEWQSVNFQTLWGKLAMLMIVGLLAAVWFSPEPWQLRDIFLTLFALWASLTHVRFLLFAAIILVPILGPRLRLFFPYDAAKDKPWLNLAMTAFIVGIIIWAFPSTSQLRNLEDRTFPHDALNFINERQLSGRLFNWLGYGSYIEWYSPNIQPFVDARMDIFIYNGTYDDYIKIDQLDQPIELLNTYKIQYVLYPSKNPLSYLLSHSTQWRAIYQDTVSTLYERVPEPAPLTMGTSAQGSGA